MECCLDIRSGAELLRDQGGSRPPRPKPVSVFFRDFMCYSGKKIVSALPFNVLREQKLFRPSPKKFSSSATASDVLFKHLL